VGDVSVTPIFDERGRCTHLVGTVHDITERKQAEDAAREQTEIVQAIVDNIPMMLVFLDASGHIQYWNRACEQMFGWSLEEARSRDLFVEFYPEEEERARAAAFAAEGSGEWQDFRTHVRDGRVLETEWANVRLSDGRTVGIGMDVTERKQIDEALRLKNAVFDASIAANSIADSAGNITEANGAFLRTWGYANRDEVVGKPILHFLQDEEEAVGIIAALNASGRWEGEYTARRKDGTTFTAFGLATDLKDSTGKLMGYQSAVIDITERKEAEAERAAAQRSYGELFDNIRVGLWRTTPGPSGTFLAVNPAMVEMFEADEPEQLLTLHPSEIYLDESQRRIVSDAIVSKGFIDEEVRFKTLKGRPIWCRITAKKVTDASGQVYFDNTIEDITERKRMKEALAERAEALARANTELQRFAYVASHDLQEPLRMIASYVQLIEKRYGDKLDADGHDFMGFIVGGANRLQTMINDLLEYSRVESRGGAFATVDCEELLTQALQNLALSIQENGATVTHDPLPRVTADPTQLAQVFQNLIGNAIKFRGEEPPRIHVSARRGGGEWVFSVRDNGIGLDPQYNERIFIVFQRLGGQEQPGTGIGLSICKRIVERHKGRIWVESEPGEGTTFHFAIPI
jgi:PAS domain S-box-containing protein